MPDLHNLDTMKQPSFEDASRESHDGGQRSTCDLASDPICIVGMACRLPGAIRTPSDLWSFITAGKTAQGRVPADRFNIDGYYHADSDRAGAMDADGGYFIQEDVRQFENDFFGINRLEATSMDPIQRKLLEAVFECLEDAGIPMTAISGTNTGVYVGNFTFDHLVKQARDSDYIHRYSATGSGIAIAANRISHVFDLRGPSYTLDTGCSSSLICLHNAVSALQSKDCEAAIVASANLVAGPEQHMGVIKGGVASRTSTCHTFDTAADGYGRADAVNAVLLKPLTSALRDGDKIWAIVRGSAINSDGRTPGISHPSADAQEAVIRKAYANAGLDFADTDYVECHGTGTATGDPIEVDALRRCFTPRKGLPVLIGSAKPGLGHSEAASGLTSLIKVILAFHNSMIPPTCGIKDLNPKLQLDPDHVAVATKLRNWPRDLRRASINAFGYGGANAHCILESPSSYMMSPAQIHTTAEEPCVGRLLVFPVSAATMKSLESRLDQISLLIKNDNLEALESLAFTLGHRLSQMPQRGFLLAQVSGPAGSRSTHVRNSLVAGSNPVETYPTAFIFTGQGAQYPEMGKELMLSEPSFLNTIRELDDILQGLPKETAPTWTLENTILEPSDSSLVNDVARSQPLCTAIQLALTRLLRGWGIHPSRVIGHSSGEIAAAYAAGLLTTKQAILTAYFRGHAVAQLTSQGAMMAVGVSAQAAAGLVTERGLDGQVSVACVNAPKLVTLSGTLEAIEDMRQLMEDRRVFCRKLETGGRAYHSPAMKSIGEIYEHLLQPYFSSEASVDNSGAKMFSSVGVSSNDVTLLHGATKMPKYWRDNLEKPVQFDAAMARLLGDKTHHHLIEIGPHSALKAPIQQILDNLQLKHLPYSATLVRKQDSHFRMQQLAGELFLHGHKLDWKRINQISKRNMTVAPHIPPYPWDYSGGVLWNESRPSVELRNRRFVRHELLGAQQLCGNGIDWAWRNVLRLREIPWLRDHMVETQIVFPAVGYLSMAIVAMSQIQENGNGAKAKAFEFRNVTIDVALVLDDDEDDQGKDVELHTTMSRRKTSTSSASTDWFDFQISSWRNDRATNHCAGSLRMVQRVECRGAVEVGDTEHYETWPSMNSWYKKLAEEGLRLGERFQLIERLETDRSRSRPAALSHTKVMPMVLDRIKSDYPVHPLIVDACVQAAIFGSTAGDLSTLRAYLPVFISGCYIGTIPQDEPERHAIIHSQTTTTGPTTKRIECTLRGSNNAPLVHLSGVRMSMYTGKTSKQAAGVTPPLRRYPCLTTHWKPDVFRLDSSVETELCEYVERFVGSRTPISGSTDDDDGLLEVSALVDLVGHKNPQMRVLEVGVGNCSHKQELLGFLDEDPDFPRYKSWTAGTITDGAVLLEKDAHGPFDIVIMSPTASQSIECLMEQLVPLLGDHGVVIFRGTETISQANFRPTPFECLVTGKHTVFAVTEKSAPQQDKNVIIIVREPSPVVSKVAECMVAHICQSTRVSFSELNSVDLSGQVTCIFLLELEDEILASMSDQDMDMLHRVTNEVPNILWLTGADMLGASNPDLALSGGLARTLALEQPSTRFTILDIGHVDDSASYLRSTCDNVLKALTPYHDLDDKEFIQHNGLLYISRFGPESNLNAVFRSRLENGPESRQSCQLAGAGRAHLAIDKVGLTDTIYFQQECAPNTIPPPGYIDVSVKAVSLNAKDVYVLSGHMETRGGTKSVEFTGVVTAVGPEVTGLEEGDRVLVVTPNNFSTTERVPAWAALKLLPTEQYTVMASLPTIYCTALYALSDRANLRAGESVLIHAGAGAFGIAAINIAQRIGAIVYSTVGSPTKKRYLVENLKVPASNIFSSRDDSFIDGIMAATDGQGVDVVVNSLSGDLLHGSWRCVANFGRFVEVGKKDLVDAGRLDMDVFLRNATFTAFDLAELLYSNRRFHRDVVPSLVKEVVRLYRAGEIMPVPITTFDIENIAHAYTHFSSRERVGKVVVSLENPESHIRIAPSKYLTCFSSEKVYLLVGCLGGLGRSLTRWMMSRGARNFVFLGRTGCDKPAAREMISYMKSTGANVVVVRGDVSLLPDVVQAVNSCRATGKPIGGVIQAAMGLSESLFYCMSTEAWSRAIRPKWTGTWNLHNALEGSDGTLDFFLMTSSVTGSIGSATESNYCAANAFLDAFSRWRRLQGKPGVSIGLGMIEEVGYLHDNPEVGTLLLRKGIQPLNENELLQVIDLALSGTGGRRDDRDLLSDPRRSHILTGLEPLGIRDHAKGLSVPEGTTQDPRMSIITAALASQRETRHVDSVVGQLSQLGKTHWLRDYTTSPAAGALLCEADAPSLYAATLRLLQKRFSALISISMDKIGEHKSFLDFGIDSMLAAEFRTWLWSTLKVDIPFLDILSSRKTLGTIAHYIAEKLAEFSNEDG
ncbi:polyketide synthase-like protein [Hypoxylon sp. NC1633]|nr:polyketide synthase-like protein [Hypoxylon sp. NC1633]